MRCSCCNAGLSDYEATRKYASTGEFADVCNTCAKEIQQQGVNFITRRDLLEEVNEDYEQFDREAD